jgi:oligopeptidase B
VLTLVLVGCHQEGQDERTRSEPLAAQRPHAVLLPEGALSDPFHWLQDESRTDPAVLDYLRQENAYSEAALAPLASTRGRLIREWSDGPEPSAARTWQDGAFVYRLQSAQDGDDWRLTRSPRAETMQGPAVRIGRRDQLLIDRKTLAGDETGFRIVAWDINAEGRRLAWLQQRAGYRSFQLLIRDLDSGRIVDPRIDGISSLAWSGDGRWLFLAMTDSETLRSSHVVRVDSEGANPVPIYTEPDAAFQVAVRRTRSNRYVTAELRATDRSEVRILHDVADESAAAQVGLPRS